MKKILMLSALALLACPISAVGGAVLADGDDASSSSSSVTKTHTVTYDYNLYGLIDSNGQSLTTVTESVEDGKCCQNQYAYYKLNSEVTLWYGTYKFAGWYPNANSDEKFDFGTGISQDFTIVAKWTLVKENEYVTTLKNSETKAQLYYEYTVTEDSGVTNYSISNIGLRFGGFIAADAWAYLWMGDHTNSYIAKYGMTWSTVSPKDKGEYDNFTDALRDGTYTFSGDNTDAYSKEKTMKEFPLPVIKVDNYMFNLYINVSSESVTKTVYAVAKVQLTNGVIYYLGTGRSASVQSLAAEYLKDTTASYSEDVKATLSLLSNGYTSGKVTK